MPENTSIHNELKKVKIKWPQLVEDKDKHRKHTMTHKAITLIQSALLNKPFPCDYVYQIRFLSSF
jgi:hypothetical protein